jgi:hypothetical protein
MLDKAKELWAEQGVHALERIRALGRMMAAQTADKGRTVITGEDLDKCAALVEQESSLEAVATQICNQTPPTGG